MVKNAAVKDCIDYPLYTGKLYMATTGVMCRRRVYRLPHIVGGDGDVLFQELRTGNALE